jgi:2-dehydro-3-deoxyglucarate aldolase/4-hydroxy-2-oxoheptanedioate aldolase
LDTLQFKRALKEGNVPIGTWIFEFNTPGITRIAASSGVDFIVYDMEHSGFGIESIRRLIAESRSSRLATLVRVPSARYEFIAPVLDIGAGGIIAPMVETADDAKRVVDACRYPPLGHRGAAFGVAHDDFLGGDVRFKLNAANDAVVASVIIETARGVENADQIAAVPGLDVAWVGFLDLSLSIGTPGQFNHPDFTRAMDRILKACSSHGVARAILVPDAQQGIERVRQGFRCLSYSGDIWLLQKSLSDGIQAIRSGLENRATQAN